MTAAKPIPAPLSRNVEVAMCLSGVCCFLGAFLSIAGLAAQGAGPQVGAPMNMAPMSSLVWLGAPVFIGGTLLIAPARLRREREERLAELRSSSALDNAAQIQVQPRTPDLVHIGTMCGVLSLITMSVVFGPVGIGCGIAATMQGHWKGLIGIVTGLAGLAWTVFLMAQVIGG